MAPQNRKSDNALLSAMLVSSRVTVERLNQLMIGNDSVKEMLMLCQLPITEQVPDIIDKVLSRHPQMADVTLRIQAYNLSTDLRGMLERYIQGIFTNEYDQQYISHRIELIILYKNIGVPAVTFVQFIDTLKGLLLKLVAHDIRLNLHKEPICLAISQLLQFDIELCVDSHLSHLKAEIDTLRRQNEELVGNFELAIAQRTKDLMQQVRLDPLTQIYNISAMQEMLDKELALAKRRQTKLSLVYFDVDHFKKINDTEGHIKGDEVLKDIAQTLRQCVRQTDIACRYGGDEFCLVLLECNAQEAQKVCEKLITTFQARYPTYSFSMGIAETGASEFVSVKQLIHLADQKMYLAKKEAGFKIVL
ncbi:GGDEF domain-containing protein [Paraglaciecola polaris]|uniref:GGDEF domain-containing protein n=1 Tax=Paraglaciecola polaris TaxID=222814 RepID=UPI0030EDD357|tara:strand:+ start:2607 stop:3692 length:1086 start_codon:yes stop_codon:yes gene_type:complete